MQAAVGKLTDDTQKSAGDVYMKVMRKAQEKVQTSLHGMHALACAIAARCQLGQSVVRCMYLPQSGRGELQALESEHYHAHAEPLLLR